MDLKSSNIDKIVHEKLYKELDRKNMMIKKERSELISSIFNNDLSKHLNDDVKAKLTLITDDTEFIVISRSKLKELIKE